MKKSVLIRAVIGFLLAGVTGIGVLQWIIEYEVEEQLDSRIKQEQVAYRSVVNGLFEVARTLYDETLNTPEVTQLVHRVVTSEGDRRDIARGLLLRRLYPSYQRLKDRGVRQLHFHRKDGISLLRFHSPLKYGDPLFPVRESVRRANIGLMPVKGFEAGRLFHGFRFVFPLYHQGTHLGSVESSVSFATIEQHLRRLVPNELFQFVLNKEQVFSMLYPSERSIYKPFSLNPDFVSEDAGAKLGTPKIIPRRQARLEEALVTDKARIASQMQQGKAFGLTRKMDGKRYAVLFTPVANPDSTTGAYIITFTKSGELDAIYRNGLIIQLIFIALVASLAVGYYRQKAASQAVARERETLKAITERMAEGLFVQDNQGRITFMNEAAENILEIKAEKAMGLLAHDLFHVHYDASGQPVDIEHCPIRKVTAAGQIYESENEFFRRASDGELVPVQVASARFLVQNQVSGSITIFRDITQRKAHEQELENARLEALNSAQAKSEFLANMSHEIRTPMNGILGMLDLLDQTGLSDEQKNFLNIAQSSSKTLLSLLNSILDLAKYEAGKVELEQIGFDLRTHLEDTVKLFAPQAQSKGLEISALIDDSVPVQVQGDPTRLRQVLTNLLGNAIKFTETGEVSLKADLQTPGDDECVLHLCVSDSGIGISPDAKDKIFDSFSQADGSTTRHYGGTGLGLTLSREIVSSMGGAIWLESEPGQGSHFHFTVRLTLPPNAAQDFQPNAELQGVRALIVDDNATNRLILQHHCDNWGIFHVSAECAEQALQLLDEYDHRGRPFDIVLTDMMMPGINGVQMAQEIRRRPNLSRTRMILLTSYTGRALRQEAQGVDFVSLIPKPFGRLELHKALEKAMSATAGRRSATDTASVIDVATPQPAGVAQGLRVLLVDDNEVNRMVAQANLNKFECRITMAADGQEALDYLCGDEDFDLVLMDCQMPVMDGLTATEHFRALEQKPETERLPIVAMTAFVTEPEIERCFAAGMDGHLPKPFEPVQLEQTLQRFARSPQESGLVSDADPITETSADTPVIAAESAPVMVSDKPMLNGQTLEDLKELFDGDLTPLTEHFFDRVPALVSEAEQALQQQDWKAMRMAVHTLKSVAANFGGEQVADIAGQIDSALYQETPTDLAVLTAQLKISSVLLLEQLNNH